MVHVSGGPELPTLAERFIGLLRLPYPIGCTVIVGLALVASVTQLGLVFAESANFQLNAIVGSMGLVYLLYAPRFMREKVLQTEKAISVLLPNGEKEFHMLFGRISAYKPQLILFILFWVLTFFSFSSDPFRFLVDNVSYSSVLSLGISCTLWTYYSALRGIHKMGAVSLNLRPYFTDALLGLRPIGSLPLYLAAAYFTAMSLGVLNTTAFPTPLSGYIALGVMILLGFVFFFLPLIRLHRRMLLQKRVERSKIAEKLTGIFRDDNESNEQTEMVRMFRLDMMERRISSIGSWPFDIQILGRLLVLVLSP